MTVSIKFRRFAAECQAMAKVARTAESKATWGRLAARWMQCAEFTEHHPPPASLPARRARAPKRYRMAVG